MARCCGCSCSARSPPSATANRCRCRVRTGGCSRSSPCTPARTSATRWPPASGPTCPTARANLRTAVWGAAPGARRRRRRRDRTSVALAGSVRDLDEIGPAIAGRRSLAARRDALRRAGRRLGGRRAGRAPAAARRGRSTRSRPRRADPADAARWTARRCALTPLDEPAHRVLIERLAAAGDRAGRSSAGRDLAERLRAELGVAPGPRPRGRCSPGLRGPAALRPAGPPGCGSRPMFGRAAELAALTAAWTAARDGHGRVVVLVTGEAGIGKTRLVARAGPAGRQRRGPRRASARASTSAARRRSRSGRSWRRALVASCRAPPEAAGWPAELGRLAPDLAAALGRRAATARRSRRRSWSGCGCSTPCCGWSSGPRRAARCCSWPRTCTAPTAASLALCAHIGRRLAALPVLFVLTRRDRPARSGRRRAARRPGRPRRRRHRDRARPAGGGRRSPRWPAASRPWPTRPSTQVVAPPTATRCSRWRAPGRWPRAATRAAAEPAGRWSGRRSGRCPSPARELAEARRGGGPRAVRGRGRGACPATATTPSAAVLDTGLVRRGAAAACAYRHALLAEAARADLRDPERTPPGGRARRRGGRRGPATPGPPRCPPPAAGGPRRPGRAPLAAGRPARPLARRAAGGRRVLGRGRALRPRRRRGLRLELAEVHAWLGPDRRVRARVGGRARPARPGRRRSARLVPARAALQDRRVQPGRLARRLPSGRGAAAPDAPDGAAGSSADRPRLERRRRPATRPAADAAARRGGGAGPRARTTRPWRRWRRPRG